MLELNKRRKGIIVMSMTKLVLFTIILAVLIGVTSIAASYLNKLSDNFSPFEMEPEVKDSMYGLACAINSVSDGKVDKDTCPNWYAEENKIFLTAPHVIKNLITGFTIGKKQYSIIKEGTKTTINYRNVQVVCYLHSKIDENFGKLNCDILHFSLPQDLSDSNIINWIRGYGTPKYVLYYEGFPQGEQAAWVFPQTSRPLLLSMVVAGGSNVMLNFVLGGFKGIGGGIKKGASGIKDTIISGFKSMTGREEFTFFKGAAREIAREGGEKTGLDIFKAGIKSDLEGLLGKEMRESGKIDKIADILAKGGDERDIKNALKDMVNKGEIKEEVANAVMKRYREIYKENLDMFKSLSSKELAPLLELDFRLSSYIQKGANPEMIKGAFKKEISKDIEGLGIGEGLAGEISERIVSSKNREELVKYLEQKNIGDKVADKIMDLYDKQYSNRWWAIRTEALAVDSKLIESVRKNMIKDSTRGIMRFLSLSPAAREKMLEYAGGIAKNYMLHGKTWKIAVINKVFEDKDPEEIVQKYYVGGDKEEVVKEIKKTEIGEALKCGVVIPKEWMMGKGIATGLCYGVMGMVFSNIFDKMDNSLYEPAGINMLGLYMPERTLYNFIYLGKKQERIKLQNQVRDKYVILHKGTLSKIYPTNEMIDEARDTTFYLVSPCKATLHVSLQRNGVENIVYPCGPWKYNLKKIINMKYELPPTSTQSNNQQQQDNGYEWGGGNYDTTTFQGALEYFCSNDFINDHIANEEMKEEYIDFCSCIPDELVIGKKDEGEEVELRIDKEIKYDPDRCKRWLMNPSIIYSDKDKEGFINEIINWLFGKSSNNKKGKILMMSKKDLINLEGKVKTECYEYRGWDYSGCIAKAISGMSDDYNAVSNCQKRYSLSINGHTIIPKEIPSKLRKINVYFCFNKVPGSESIYDQLKIDPSVRGWVTSLTLPTDKKDANVIFINEMCVAKMGTAKEEGVSCNIYVLKESVLQEMKNTLKKALENTPSGMCFPGDLAMEEYVEKNKKKWEGNENAKTRDLAKILNFLYVSQPIAQANEKPIVLESIPQGIFDNGYTFVLPNGDVNSKKYWSKGSNNKGEQIVNSLFDYLGIGDDKIKLGADSVLISVKEKEKTKGYNYCYMPATSTREWLTIYAPSFLLDMIGAVLERTYNPLGELGAAVSYFMSGAYIEYQETTLRKEKQWPKSWGVKEAS